MNEVLTGMIGEILRGVRRRKKIKLKDVARKTRESISGVCAVERGERNINVSTLFKFLRALDMSFQDFAAEMGEPSNEEKE